MIVYNYTINNIQINIINTIENIKLITIKIAKMHLNK